MNDLHYIAAGRLIVAVLGRDSDIEYCGGLPIENARVYEDNNVKIICSRQNLEFGMTKKDNDNPVYFMTAIGELIRVHGEVTYLKRHILDLCNRASENIKL